MTILKTLITCISLLTLLLCLLAPLNRTALMRSHPRLKKLLGFHAAYGIILLVTGFIHGILSGSGSAMITGKVTWMLLLILVILSAFRNKIRPALRLSMHRVLAAVFCLFVTVHIVHAIIT